MIKLKHLIAVFVGVLAVSALTYSHPASAHNLAPWEYVYTQAAAGGDNHFAFSSYHAHINGSHFNFHYQDSLSRTTLQTPLYEAASQSWGGMISYTETESWNAHVKISYSNFSSPGGIGVTIRYGNDANGHIRQGYGDAEIIIYEGFTSYNSLQKRQVIAHELGHLWAIADLYTVGKTGLTSIYSDGYAFETPTRHDKNALRIAQNNQHYDSGNGWKYLKHPGVFAMDECMVGYCFRPDGIRVGGSQVLTSKTFTGDVNGDGRSDIILSRGENGKRVLSVFLGQANGTFSGPVNTSSSRTYSNVDPVFVGDFNGDGKTDVLVHWASGGYRQLLVYTASYGGSFNEGVNLYSSRKHDPNQWPAQFFVADMNGDNRDDFIVHWKNAAGKRNNLVYRGSSISGTPMLDANYDALASTNTYWDWDPVFVGDVNGDNRDDMVVHWNTTDGYRQLLSYLGNSNGYYSAGVNLASIRKHDVNQWPTKFFMGDANGDGKQDFIAHWKNAAGKRNNHLYPGKSASPFLGDATNNALTSTNNYVDSDPVFIGDVNGDGRDDMVVHWASSAGYRQLLTYIANSNNTYNLSVNFASTRTHNQSVNPCTIHVADVTGDGKDDVIIKWKTTSGWMRFLVYRGTNSGSYFLEAVETVPRNFPYNIYN